MKFDNLTEIDTNQLGENVPRRNGKLAPKISSAFLKMTGWKIVGEIPNIKKCVLLAVPHTSNIDGVFAIPTLLALNVDINGQKTII